MTNNNTPIRIIIAEDQAVVRAGLIAIFKQLPDIKVVGEAENGLQALELYKELNPQVVLLDLVMPVMDGLTTISKLLEINPNARILIVTGFGEADNVYEAIAKGASGLTLKDSTYEQLLEAIRTVARGEEYIPASVAMRMVRERSKRMPLPEEPESLTIQNQKLTKREVDTLRGLAAGLSNQEIAKKLFVQDRTVAKYVSKVLEKLELDNRTQAAIYAIKAGIIEHGSTQNNV